MVSEIGKFVCLVCNEPFEVSGKRRSAIAKGRVKCKCEKCKRQYLKHPKYPKINIGDKFGRLTVLESTGKDKNYNVLWRCICSCINKTEVTVRQYSLHSGHSVSCGCARRSTFFRLPVVKMPGYSIWKGIKGRCYRITNKSYLQYGGRGITICDRWRNSFENFLEDMGERPGDNYSLDRIDPDGDYSPENCRWANKQDQARNKSDRVLYTFNDQTMTIPQWVALIEMEGIRQDPIGISFNTPL